MRALAGWSATNARAAFWAATIRLGATSVARMLPETSIARMIVSCCDGRVTIAVGRAMATRSITSASRNNSGGRWRRNPCPAPIASRIMARLA